MMDEGLHVAAECCSGHSVMPQIAQLKLVEVIHLFLCMHHSSYSSVGLKYERGYIHRILIHRWTTKENELSEKNIVLVYKLIFYLFVLLFYFVLFLIGLSI